MLPEAEVGDCYKAILTVKHQIAQFQVSVHNVELQWTKIKSSIQMVISMTRIFYYLVEIVDNQHNFPEDEETFLLR